MFQNRFLQSRPVGNASTLRSLSTVVFEGNSYRPTKPTPLLKWPPKFKSVKLVFGSKARKAIAQGINTLSSTSQVTLGPGGRNVALEYEAGDPKITKDGVTVLKSIHLANRAQEIGAKLLKRSVGSTNTYAGDGTTSSSVLTKMILEKGIQAVDFEKAHPVAIKRGLDKGLKIVQQFLKDIAMPVTTEQEIQNVCYVSTNFDKNIAEIVAKTLNTVGLDGVINMTESPVGMTRFAMVNGLVIERGYVSQLFSESVNSGDDQSSKENKVDQIVDLEQPLVLVVADKISKVSEISPVMDLVKQSPSNRPLLIFSEDLQDEPMSTMIYNNQKDIIQCCAVNLPWQAGIQKEILKDIAVMTGATLVDNEFGLKIEDVKLEHFGSAKTIRVDQDFTHIIGGSFTKEQMAKRYEEIETTIELEPSKHLKNVHKERLARMKAMIAEIQIGGNTEVEQGAERDLIVDALNSAKSAMEYGVLPGGGVALYQASKTLEHGLADLISDENEAIGVRILQEALKQPIRTIIENKKFESSASIIEQIEQSGDMFTGYDVQREQVCDMIESGIVDSQQVVQAYLQDAVTLAGMLLTTECLVLRQKGYTPLSFKHYQDRRDFF